MAEYEKLVRALLQENGCTFVRHGKGDHDVWHSPINNHTMVVAVKIKNRHTANAIMKQAGIKHHF